MAGRQTFTLPFAGIYPVNRLAEKNRFKARLNDLLRELERELERPNLDPYAERDPDRRPHEHDTRLLFVNELLSLLDWKLGVRGNVLQEARLQANTTKFMDYVGVVEATQKPLLLVEAKAWDKPQVSPRGDGTYASEAALVAAAIKHIRDGKPAGTSPIISEWDSYLRQVHGYLETLKTRYKHTLPRAIIISGEWIAVFRAPDETFLGIVLPDDIVIFYRPEFRERAEELFELLHRSVLTEEPPVPLRPAQLTQYLELNDVSGTFMGVHVHYERSGSTLFTPRPRILIYPAIFVVRTDGAVYTVIRSTGHCELDYQTDPNGADTLALHLDEVRQHTEALIELCGMELGGALLAAEISQFPGFPSNEFPQKAVTAIGTVGDDWLIATGDVVHFLLLEPRVGDCRYHSWQQCGDDATLQSAISIRSVNPPSFFVDNQRHHCAHQVVQDRRENRCLIKGIDSRTCCQACVFYESCWTEEEKAALPCGR
ncbi:MULTISPECIES: hypothetical protein [Pseudomonas]|uniref:hypothetical protein n=1 Tax=Pseudomonas TaxID=286 RepID=UPI00070A1F7E|nr:MULTISPECIES: hypothetical protein [Pseudomonas]MBI6673874.1 hypothetical protein [Pseudomonas syringae]MBP1084642.1 hypothetical protein [Pseudomonas sp. PvP007]MBP1194320.1 hypothetical protein [Pseudomonas sp. PvP100]MBS7473506.1 hypothetical protein [Pseudomonas syringae]MCH5522177.1 hypothetical protein [Pseudomonas syringae pv. lapsa]